MVTVKSTSGEKLSVDADLGNTVLAFKGLIAALTDCPVEQQRLIYKGQVLKDEKTLTDYGVLHAHTVILVKGTKPTKPPTTPEATPGSVPTVSVSAPVGGTPAAPASGVPASASFGGTPSGASPFAGMGSMAEMQRQMMENPELMREMMSSPLMQSLLDNPELLQGMIASNPALRELMERNPEIAHVLNDPAILRQSLELARNPDLMREMMRSSDRALSNIEAHPEGFNALRRMYETLQEPLMSASSAPGAAATPTRITPDEPTDSSAAPDSAPLPNPWASAPSTTPAASGAPGLAPAASPFGMMGMPGMMPGMGDPESMLAMLENPMMQAMLQQMMSSPETIETMLRMNPSARAMMEANPGMAEMLRSPEFLRMMSDPGTLRAMLQMQVAMSRMQGGTPGSASTPGGSATGASPFGPYSGLFMPPSGTGAAPGSGTSAVPGTSSTSAPATNPFPGFVMPPMGTGAAPASRASSGASPGVNPFASMFGPGAFGSGGFGAAAPAEVRPEIIYRDQLAQLNSMGFTDPTANINALIMTGGNVEAAVDRLLSGS